MKKLLLFALLFICVKGFAQVTVTDHSYSYDPATGIIDSLEFNVNITGGISPWEIHINLFKVGETTGIAVAAQTGFGGSGGGNSTRHIQFNPIDLNIRENLTTGTYRIAVYIPQATPNLFFLGPETETIEYTKVNSSASVTDFQAQISVFPNPMRQRGVLEIQSSLAGEVHYSIFDTQGRLLQREYITVIQGENLFDLNFSAYSTGTYFLVIKGEEINYTHKLNIVN